MKARPLFWLGLIVATMAGLASTMGATGPVASVSTTSITCGPRLDGGLVADAAVDGGTEIDQIVVGGNDLTYWVPNPSATSVFIGGSDVQPDNAPCISTDTANCTRSELFPNARRGTMYCTSETAVTLKVMAGGPQ